MTTALSASADPPVSQNGVDGPVDDDDASIDEEQLEEYREMVDNLGQHPDKVKINSLSMVAEDHSESKAGSKAIYKIIRDRLLGSSREKLLPLVYLVDSILKNAKGHYIEVVEEDAANWIPGVHKKLQEPQKAKLQKVWKTWNDSRIFSAEKLKAMGRCFDENVSGKSLSSSTAQVAGINRTKDGSLLLPKVLREEMQNVLDDMQRDVTERDKLSLERLADIHPDLLGKIKETAQENMQMSSSTNQMSGKSQKSSLPDFFTETRSPEMLERVAAWNDNAKDVLKEAKDATDALSEELKKAYQERYTQAGAMEMTQHVATASAVATFLSQAVEMIQQDKEAQKTDRKVVAGASSGFRVDPALFTNEGVKQKNTAVVGLLYEVGLPFQSSADGRRFRTQLELSKHLDALFKRAQLEKSITRAEERGWYISDGAWQGQKEEAAPQMAVGMSTTASNEAATPNADGYNPETSTMPADESRDRCAICGLNFKMFFDNEDGIYQYRNCREIEVLNDDDVALNESEQMLIHVTCWRALGSPEVLTMDQALVSNTVRH